ncbi:MAG: hypothetical protein AAF290_00625 [Pseudomonadota bacterium]
MKTLRLLVTGLFVAASASAEQYDWEVGADISRTTTEQTIGLFGPGGSPGNVRIENDADAIGIGATWFFEGLEISEGPRTEAPFLSRTSSLSFAYSRVDFDSTTTSPVDVTTSSSGDSDGLGFRGRYVWKDSGWFALGSYSRSEAFSDATVTTLTAGVGRYVARNTTISATLGRTEVDTNVFDDTSSGVILAAKHIGQFRNQWRYGFDIDVSNQEFGDASGQYGLGFSLFPNDDLVLAFNSTGQIGGSNNEQQGYRLSGGWFVLPDVEITAGYDWVDVDSDETVDIDTNGFNIGVNYRF